jgi:Flp pilus assembly secretin CpaC
LTIPRHSHRVQAWEDTHAPPDSRPLRQSEPLAPPRSAVADGRVAPLSVSAGEAARIVLSAPVRDLVVGDPSVADVSLVNERTLVVLGKKAGATTVLAFDARGQALADRDVVVSDVPSPGGHRPARLTASTYACGDRCSLLPAPTPPPQVAGRGK